MIVYFAQRRVSCRSHCSLPSFLPCSIFGPVEEHTEERLHTHKVCSGQSYAGLQHAGWLHPMQKKNKAGLCFGHKTDFCCIQQPARSENDGFYVIHLMMEYRRDVQSLCMKSSSDTHIQRWAEAFGAVPDNRLRNDFYRIQQEIASIIIKDVLEENGMFYGGPISRADVRTRIALQRQDMTPFTKLGCVLPDMDRWEECTA